MPEPSSLTSVTVADWEEQRSTTPFEPNGNGIAFDTADEHDPLQVEPDPEPEPRVEHLDPIHRDLLVTLPSDLDPDARPPRVHGRARWLYDVAFSRVATTHHTMFVRNGTAEGHPLRLAFAPGDVVMWRGPEGEFRFGAVLAEWVAPDRREALVEGAQLARRGGSGVDPQTMWRHELPRRSNRWVTRDTTHKVLRLLDLPDNPDRWSDAVGADEPFARREVEWDHTVAVEERDARLEEATGGMGVAERYVPADLVVYHAGSLLNPADVPVDVRTVRRVRTQRTEAEREQRERHEAARAAREAEQAERERIERLHATAGLEPGVRCLVVPALHEGRSWDAYSAHTDFTWRPEYVTRGTFVTMSTDEETPRLVRNDGEVFVRVLTDEGSRATGWAPRRALLAYPEGAERGEAEMESPAEAARWACPDLPTLSHLSIDLRVRIPMLGTSPCYGGITTWLSHLVSRELHERTVAHESYLPAARPSDWDPAEKGEFIGDETARAILDGLSISVRDLTVLDADWRGSSVHRARAEARGGVV